MVFGGEALDIGDLRGWWERHGDTTPQLHQHVRHHRDHGARHLSPAARGDRRRPAGSVIGVAVPDLRVYVLDAKGRLQGNRSALPGELYIGGAGVAKGYLNRPQQTAEKFVGLSAAKLARVYRSGDQVLLAR